MKEQFIELAGIVKVLVRGLSASGEYPDWMDKELFMLSAKLSDLIEEVELSKEKS